MSNRIVIRVLYDIAVISYFIANLVTELENFFTSNLDDLVEFMQMIHCYTVIAIYSLLVVF